MKILHLSLADGGGGAHIAARRLHLALLASGMESEMLVDNKSSDSPAVSGIRSELMRGLASCRPSVDNMFTKLRCKTFRGGSFFSNRVPDFIKMRLKKHKFDIINLHWVSGGFLRPQSIPKLGVPFVWTMHDMWPFTGGCLYSGDCIRYESRCGRCIFCNSTSEKDVSTANQMLKLKAYSKAEIRFVSPSKWLGDCAKKATIMKNADISVIPNCLDTTIFYPRERTFARSTFGLPLDREIILCCAAGGLLDFRKGGDLLIAALKKMGEIRKNRRLPLLLVLGGEKSGLCHCDGIDFLHIGKVHDEITLSLLYSAADVFAAPSRIDNLPNTVIEALACGIPTVAFNVGGMPDILDGSGGCLVSPFDIDGYAHALCETIQSRSVTSELNRSIAEARYSMKNIASLYTGLYAEMLKENAKL